MRLPDLPPDQMSLRQREVAIETASGKRGRMPAPLRAWIHSPEMGARAQRLGEVLRYDTSLGPRLSEMAILMMARHWTSDYEWFVHKREALKAGLAPTVIDAIAVRRAPEGLDARAQALFDYATELLETRSVSDDTHSVAVAALGQQGVVELVGLLGYYTLVSMTLNAFAIGLPEGETPELSR